MSADKDCGEKGPLENGPGNINQTLRHNQVKRPSDTHWRRKPRHQMRRSDWEMWALALVNNTQSTLGSLLASTRTLHYIFSY